MQESRSIDTRALARILRQGEATEYLAEEIVAVVNAARSLLAGGFQAESNLTHALNVLADEVEEILLDESDSLAA